MFDKVIVTKLVGWFFTLYIPHLNVLTNCTIMHAFNKIAPQDSSLRLRNNFEHARLAPAPDPAPDPAPAHIYCVRTRSYALAVNLIYSIQLFM